MIVKNIGEVEVLMDFSLNTPMGYVYAGGKWYSGPISDTSRDVNINEYMASKPEIITEEPSAAS